jgi:hypothetical protein
MIEMSTTIESICLWCGAKTSTENGSKEHVFPVTIGGKETLPFGSVCKSCNNKLGFLDQTLKYGHEAMMFAFQREPRIVGRIRDPSDEERKKREKFDITGKGQAKDVRIKRNVKDTSFINASFTKPSEDYSRSLHKCTANNLCGFYGSKFVRERFTDLLKFVWEGGDVRPWSFAVSFPIPYAIDNREFLVSEPKLLLLNENVMSFIHTSGIWITGCQPFSLNQQLIEVLSKLISGKLDSIKDPVTGKKATDFYGFNWDLSKKIAVIGNLKFLWIVKTE